MNKKVKVIVMIGIIIVLIVALYFVSNALTKTTGYTISGDNTNAENLAKCMADKNITMYGSKYCPHCAQQKSIFGDAFKFVNYVECSENADLCSGLEGVPAWNIKEKMYYGTMSLDELKKLSDC